MKPLATVAVGLGLVLLAWLGSFSSGIPSLTCPMPTVTVIPAFFLASLRSHPPFWLAILVPAILFFAWNPGLLRGGLRVPRRSWVLLIALTVLSLAYFVGSWNYGYQYQGREHTVLMCAINGGWIVALWAMLYRSVNTSSFSANLLFHATLFAWLAWYAFPYLGELL